MKYIVRLNEISTARASVVVTEINESWDGVAPETSEDILNVEALEFSVATNLAATLATQFAARAGTIIYKAGVN